MTRNFFVNLYCEDFNTVPFPIHGGFPMVSPEDWEFVNRPLSSKEIKSTLFSMGSLKAPGPDGLHALFFQSQWNVVGESVCSLVSSIFHNPEEIKLVNQTHISLIPKIEHPELVKHFRPISLCNVIYKLVTKIVANRFKRIMPTIIAPTQCGFIHGRTGSNNIIIAQEVIHKMRQMKGQKGFMAIKIDMEKAYDKLD